MEIKKDKFFVPDYDRLLSLINTKTKLVYLSSPNIISGQNIVDNKVIIDPELENFLPLMKIEPKGN